MTEFTATDVDIRKDYGNDGMTDTWTVTFTLHLDGDEYVVHREFEWGEYGESSLSIVLDGLDLTDANNWPVEGEAPHVVKALGDPQGVTDAGGTFRYTYWMFDAFQDWVDATFLHPIWAAVEKAETDTISALCAHESIAGEVPDAE